MLEGVPTVMLDRQYRMHPHISAFPSKEFYGGNLIDGFDASAIVNLRPPASSYLVPSRSVVFLNHDEKERRKGGSRLNEGEANIVAAIVEDLLVRNPVGRCSCRLGNTLTLSFI